MKTKKKQKAKAKFISNSLLNSCHHRDQSLMHECQIQVINLVITTAWFPQKKKDNHSMVDLYIAWCGICINPPCTIKS